MTPAGVPQWPPVLLSGFDERVIDPDAQLAVVRAAGGSLAGTNVWSTSMRSSAISVAAELRRRDRDPLERLGAASSAANVVDG